MFFSKQLQNFGSANCLKNYQPEVFLHRPSFHILSLINLQKTSFHVFIVHFHFQEHCTDGIYLCLSLFFLSLVSLTHSQNLSAWYSFYFIQTYTSGPSLQQTWISTLASIALKYILLPHVSEKKP